MPCTSEFVLQCLGGLKPDASFVSSGDPFSRRLGDAGTLNVASSFCRVHSESARKPEISNPCDPGRIGKDGDCIRLSLCLLTRSGDSEKSGMPGVAGKRKSVWSAITDSELELLDDLALDASDMLRTSSPLLLTNRHI